MLQVMNGVMQMKADDSKGERVSPASFLGIIILVIGLLVAVGQFFSIGNEVNDLNQTGLLASLCYIAVGMAIEFFGIGLIIVGNRK
jgi:hypothetical protein